jgi:hypothetical protein
MGEKAASLACEIVSVIVKAGMPTMRSRMSSLEVESEKTELLPPYFKDFVTEVGLNCGMFPPLPYIKL